MDWNIALNRADKYPFLGGYSQMKTDVQTPKNIS